MAGYRYTITVAAPIDVVFDLWTNLERQAEWIEGLTLVTDIAGPVDRVGATWVNHFGPMRSPTEVIEVQRPIRFTTRFGSAILKGTSTSTLREVEGGTELTQEFRTIGLVSAFFARVFATGSKRGSFRGEIEHFRQLAEAEHKAGHVSRE